MQHPWMRWSVRKPVQWLRHSFHGVAAGCPTPTPPGGLTATIAAAALTSPVTTAPVSSPIADPLTATPVAATAKPAALAAAAEPAATEPATAFAAASITASTSGIPRAHHRP